MTLAKDLKKKDCERLVEETRRKVVEMLNGYIQAKEITENIDTYLVLPGLQDNAGVLGAIRLAVLNS